MKNVNSVLVLVAVTADTCLLVLKAPRLFSGFHNYTEVLLVLAASAAAGWAMVGAKNYLVGGISTAIAGAFLMYQGEVYARVPHVSHLAFTWTGGFFLVMGCLYVFEIASDKRQKKNEMHSN